MAVTTAMANTLCTSGSLSSVTTSTAGAAGSGVTMAGAVGSTGSIWIGSGGGTGASAGSGLTMGSSGSTIGWSHPNYSNTQITMRTSNGDEIVLTADILNRIIMLIDVILELPDTHALADLKRDLLVKESMQILGKPDESIR